jgi:uncharacterized delta-60 repeat protein
VIGGFRFGLAAVVATAASVAVAPGSAFGASAGAPDTTFNGTGVVTTGFGTTPFHAADSGNAAARDGTGGIYVAGTTPANNNDIAVVRLTAAGVLDTSFGNNGIVTTDIGGADDRGTGVAIDGSGNVLVAGTTGDQSTGDDFALVRYTSAGVPDSTFGGGDGVVTTDFGANTEDVAAGIALVGGSPIVAGYTDTNSDPETNSYDFAVAKYTSAGVLDSSFDGDGRVTTDFGSDQDQGFTVLGTGSTFVVAGRTDPSGADVDDFALARYTASTGALDGTFGSGGKQTVDFSGTATGNGDFAAALAIDSSNKIVVAGSTGSSDCGVARLSGTDGTPDNTFDSDGKQTVSTPASGSTLGSADQCYAVAVEADNSIVLGGLEFTNGNDKWVLSHLSSAGVLQTVGFGTSGFVITDFNSTPGDGDRLTGLFVDDTSSKIIATGTGNSNFAAARYSETDGSVDTSFGTNNTGEVEVDIVSAIPSASTARGVAVQPDGKIVVVGPTNAGPTLQTKGDQEFGLARYNANGSLDQGFGVGGPEGNGRVVTNFDTNPDETGTNDSPAAVALQPDGKILVVGMTDPPGADKGDSAIARYMPDGSLDSSFGGGDGLVTTDFGGANGDSADAIALHGTPGDSDFRIAVAGSTRGTGQLSDIAVAVYNEDGTPDDNFDTDGRVTTLITGVASAHDVAILPDGSVLAGGEAGLSTGADFALVRYTPTGIPDAGFGGGDGIVTTDFGSNGHDRADAVAVRELGAGQEQIILAGRATTASGLDGALAAYTTDGSPDTSFSGDGLLSLNLNSDFKALFDVAFQPDGKIVAAGGVDPATYGVVRVKPTGALDTSFGGDGLASTSFPNPFSLQYSAQGVAIEPNGNLVTAGGALNPISGSNFFVTRYLGKSTPAPPVTTPPPTTPPATTPPATPTKKKCKKKKHRAATSKKCKKKKRK